MTNRTKRLKDEYSNATNRKRIAAYAQQEQRIADRKREQERRQMISDGAIKCPVCKEEKSFQVVKPTADKKGWKTYLYCEQCGRTIFHVHGFDRNDVLCKFRSHYYHILTNGIAPAVVRSTY